MKINFGVLVVVVALVGLGVGAAFAAGTAAGRAQAQPTNQGQSRSTGVGASSAASANQGQTAPQGSTGSSAEGSQQFQRGGFGQSGTGGAFSRPTLTGTIEKIEGDVVTLNTGTGSVQVKLDQNTQLRKTVEAEQSDLASGVRVVVTGERQEDGSYNATLVQIGVAGQATSQPRQP